MKNFVFVIMFVVYSMAGFAQIENLTEKFELPSVIDETSGLLFSSNKLITHNDSGDAANLYEIDTITGNISRTVNISNATHIDWEDIAQDAAYIYIGDIGNNNGNRTDLKIYRINKADYINNSSVMAEVINFSYEDQTDFSTQPNSSNFDAEAISVYEENIVLFTKNWANNMTNAYIISKDIGTHSAKKVSTYNVDGLITGATYNPLDKSFMLCGYSATLSPFLVYVRNFTGNDFFNGTVERSDISSNISLSQIEGVAHITNGRYFLSREKFEIGIVFPSKLYSFNNASFTLSINEIEDRDLTIYPNPVHDTLNIQVSSSDNIKYIVVFDTTGKHMLERKLNPSHSVNFNKLKNGLYFIKIVLDDNAVFYKKIVKSDRD